MLIPGPVGYRLPEQDGHAAGYITAEDLKKVSLGVQEAVMRVWFHEHYDPPDELPYDGREGGYQFIFGGPYDPEEELESEFGEIVPESVINELARKLWNLHSEWSGLDPGPDPDDDYVQHLYGSIKESLGPFEEFTRSLTDIRGLRGLEVEQSRQQCLNRLLYANVITSLEAYLSDFFQTAVEKHPKLRRRFVETTPEFSKQRFSLSEVFEEHERIEAKVGEYLVAVLWHNLAVVRNMFADTLGIKFPDEMVRLFKAVLVRHDLVHRNGRKKEGGEHSITLNEVDELLGMAESLVNDIEKQWKTLDPANEF
jgi:HEPN superfamily RiboL-PSP-like protein